MSKIIGIGVDLVQNNRIRQIIFKSYLDNFLRKVLHEKQLEQYEALKMLSMQTQFIASRWAVKQAAVKALGRKQLVFDQMRIFKDQYGQPHLDLEGHTNLEIKQKLNLIKVHISLAHQDEYTIAYALAVTQEKLSQM